MTKYKVNCYRTVGDILRQDVTVEAETASEAESKAIEIAKQNDEWRHWQCGANIEEDTAEAIVIDD